MSESSAVIAASDFARISERLSDPSIHQSKKYEALLLHQKSKARSTQWTNTLEGSRKAELEFKQREQEALEVARQKLDEQEAYFQQSERRSQIDRANALLARESDRMKSFGSAMLASDVIAEREAQLRLKEELMKLERIRDEKYSEMDRHNYRSLLERELREKHRAERLVKETCSVQNAQLEQAKTKKISEIQADMKEGALLREKAKEAAEDERKADELRRKAALAAVLETQKSNAYLKEIKEREKRRELREQLKIERYALEKEKMAETRKIRENQILQEKQQTRLRMIERQSQELLLKRQNEAHRTDSSVAQKIAQDDALAIAKSVKLKALMDDIRNSRMYQIYRKQQELETTKQTEAESAQRQRLVNERLQVEDDQERDERMAANIRLKQEQLLQISSKRKSKLLAKSAEHDIVNRAQQADLIELHNFQQFAEKTIKEYAEEGKNVIPLIKELQRTTQ